MSGTLWTAAQLKKLEQAHRDRKPWMTDTDIARILSGQIHKSQEAIRWQLRTLHKVSEPKKPSPPKILLLDIETLPYEGKFWGLWKQDFQPMQIKKYWSIVCWSAKWLFDSKIYGEVVTPQEAIDRQDKSIMGGLWKLLDEANYVITHNGNSFDNKKINTRLLINGFHKPSPFISIDTLAILQKQFDFPYNRLNEVNKMLGLSLKIHTGWEWWDKCSEGDKKYLDLMLKYNKQDVNVLEELYMKLRPWTPTVNMNIFDVTGLSVCPTCGSVNIQPGIPYTTPKGLYKGFRCQDCGSMGRTTGKKSIISTTQTGGI